MAEILEPVAPGKSHAAQNKKCPFCPQEPPPDFTTYPGSANDSGKLECIMCDPPKLVSEQSGARPKEGNKHQQNRSRSQPKPTPIYTAPTHGDYSCEAHHLISGKQALQGHKFERWIVAGSTIKKDTGYSVNNADNGIWAPSIPEKYKGGTWGGMSPAQKKKIAEKVMAAVMVQFHKGHHAIGDPDDPDQEVHQKYNDYIKGKLTVMDDRMRGWAKLCPLCDKGKKKTKLQPSVRTNQALDNLSKHMRGKITGAPDDWNVFLSRLALEYHLPVCSHTIASE